MEEFAYSLKQPNPTHQRKDVISILQHLFERNLIVTQGHEQVNVKSDYKHSLKTDSMIIKESLNIRKILIQLKEYY